MAYETEKLFIDQIEQDIKNELDNSKIILDSLYDFAEALSKRIGRDDIDNFSCKKGCYYCCNVSVSLFTYELFNIVNYVKTNNIDILEDIINSCDCIDTKSSQEWGMSGLYCPFLHKRQKYCIIYPVRPATCRAVLSRNNDICIHANKLRASNSHNFMLISREQDDAYQYIQLILACAEEKSKLPLGGIELVSAMKIALSDEAALKKWLAGENIFATCRVNATQREVRV